MTNKINKPQIRFKGFNDAWEQRKLEDVAEFSKGDGYSKGDLCAEGTPIILYGRLYTKFETIIKEVDTFAIPKDRSVYSKGGEVIVPASGESSEDIARAATVENAGILLGGDINIVTPNKGINSAFLALSISNGEAQKELAKKAQGKSIVHIHNEEIKGLNISFPTRTEQDSISVYFSRLDKLITLHQHKYDLLTKVKKSMIDKMFPKNNSIIPEIRFKEFSDVWEQRKVSEIAGVYDGVHQTPDYKTQGIMFLSVENINSLKSNKFISEEAFKRDYKVYPEYGDVLMTRIGDVGTPNVVETTEKLAFYVSLALLKPKGIDSYFLSNSILSPAFQKGLKDRTLVTAIPQKINKDEIGKVYISLPQSVEEQRVIGEYFHQLNNLITLHQQKLTKLKNIKKAMLEKMFV